MSFLAHIKQVSGTAFFSGCWLRFCKFGRFESPIWSPAKILPQQGCQNSKQGRSTNQHSAGHSPVSQEIWKYPPSAAVYGATSVRGGEINVNICFGILAVRWHEILHDNFQIWFSYHPLTPLPPVLPSLPLLPAKCGGQTCHGAHKLLLISVRDWPHIC